MNKLKTIVSLLPTIFSAVKSIEEAANLPRIGSQKLALLMELIGAVYPEVDAIREAVEKVVAAVVKFFNGVGIFKKS